MRIEGSVALVTGANRGLGQHFAEQLLAMRMDVTDTDSIAAAVETASDTTLLINNAGIYTTGARSRRR